jgi:hypothetical protein
MNLADPSFVCQTPDIPEVAYNREVHADGALSFTADGPGLLQLIVFALFDSPRTPPGTSVWRSASSAARI